MIPEFYAQQPGWPGRIERIAELLGRVSALESLAHNTLELRRANRIMSVHSSTAIEGNQLSLAQVDEVANGEAVLAPPRDVLEVENALAAYDALVNLDPWSVPDFLEAHRLLTTGLIREAGSFRSVGVDIVNANGAVIHSGSRPQKVPRLIAELFEWGSSSTEHPLIISSATHFLIEHIHPFRDGNGRIGRLWQTLILSKWRPIFVWMPVESLIRNHQAGYYSALQNSREPVIDAATFINFMFEVIEKALVEYELRAKLTSSFVGVNVGVNVGVKLPDAICLLLQADPALTTSALAEALDKTPRTIERHLRELKAQGRVERVGSAKTGHWQVNRS